MLKDYETALKYCKLSKLNKKNWFEITICLFSSSVWAKQRDGEGILSINLGEATQL